MKSLILIKQLQDAIKDKKVIAAVFYTYNFDAKFFENYLLPSFLPHVPFNENEIQNTILWKHYQRELPLITVYCDFHAKGIIAPSLNYTICPVDLVKNEVRKPAFHPKVSFILCDDWSLIVIIGSNNISEKGWCRNIEACSIIKLENGKYFPREFKDTLRSFLHGVNILYHKTKSFSQAEEKIEEFFIQRLYTKKPPHLLFYDPFNKTFWDILNLLKEKNKGAFDEVEIISPYLNATTDLITFSDKNDSISEFLKTKKIKMLIPYGAFNEVAMSESSFNEYEKCGVTWCDLKNPGNEKTFRFNHSKVYRLYGDNKVFTIIGSVNFTGAGTDGYYDNGNIETAIIYEEKWEDSEQLLKKSGKVDLRFTQPSDEEGFEDSRANAPDLAFTIDWGKRDLTYSNSYNKFKGYIAFDGLSSIMIQDSGRSIYLDEKKFEYLANNAIMKVHESNSKNIFYFFPEHINIEFKPISSKIKISDIELLELWNNLSVEELSKEEIANAIEKLISKKTDPEGELIPENTSVKSTLNLMASHISSLINLEKKIFKDPQFVRDFPRHKEIMDYYLFNDNFDTILGYRKLLKKMESEGQLKPSFYWLLLLIIERDFYDKKKICDKYKKVSVSDKDNTEYKNMKVLLTVLQSELLKELKQVRTVLNTKKVENKLLDWILNTL